MADNRLITAFIEEAVKRCFDGIGRYITYTRKYKRNIDNLNEALQKIEDTKDTILFEVRRAKDNAENIRQDVVGWITRFEELKSQANVFFENTRPFHVSCLSCSCPNLRARYLASTEASIISSLIQEHKRDGDEFDKVGQEPVLDQMPHLSPGEFYGFGSRMAIMKEVMDGLKDDSISVVGICGMAGIGKTMLVKKIADEVKNEKLFDEVAFVVVSRDPKVKGIQDQLASRLRLTKIANETDIRGRAELLHKRLIQEKQKILVILDDMWEKLDLSEIGIILHGEHRQIKILMTSRFDSVCADMEVQKRLEVGILSKDEAWNLFKMTAKIVGESASKAAKAVSNECAGLPLAIVTVGNSLKDKQESAFSYVLETLKDPSRSNNSKIHALLYNCIKSSYDYLENDEHRSLLLLCSAFPEDYDIPMEDLVRYARGLFNTFETMAKARDGVEAIVDELMKCYLLLHGERRKCVKLHDVVRDVCLSIGSERGGANILFKFDDKGNMCGLKSQRLSLLRPVNKDVFWKSRLPSGNMSLEETDYKDLKFSEMEELRVLEANNITTGLPSPQKFMINLHTLSLDYCRLKGDLAGIGSLKMLRVLSFFHSIVEMFPMKIAELTNLQCLDLRFHLMDPATFLPGALSSLKELEELYLGDISSENIANLEEISSLSKLHTIQFVVKDDNCLEVLLKNLEISNIIRFDIARVTGGFEHIEYQIRENMLKLLGQNVHMENRMKALIWKSKCLYYNGEKLTNVVDVLGGDSGFRNLKELMLYNCDMQHLVDAPNHLAEGVFGELETLHVNRARQLEELIASQLMFHENPLNARRHSPNFFGNLRRLVIFDCPIMKTLFSKSMVKWFGKLESIEIQLCLVLESIVRVQKEVSEFPDLKHLEQARFEEYQFPKLNHLKLYQLPKLRSMTNGRYEGAVFNEVKFPKLEDLTIILCDGVNGRKNNHMEVCSCLDISLPKVRYLYIEDCNNLLTIARSGLMHGFQDLETLTASNCLSLEAVFDFEDILVDMRGPHRVLSETQMGLHLETAFLDGLESLYLNLLPKLKHIWKSFEPNVIDVTRNLKKIQVKKCISLKYLLPPAVTIRLVHLEEIELECNEKMQAIIGSEIDHLKGSIALPKLQKLKICYLQYFWRLCSTGLKLQLPSLTELQIINIPVNILIRETDAFQNLTKIKVEECGDFTYLLISSGLILVHLEDLVLHKNKSMEAIFGAPRNPDRDEIPNQSIELPKLKKLEISTLRNFKMLCCSLNLNVYLPSLTQLCIRECPKMSKLCAGQLRAPKLLNVDYGEMETEVAPFIDSWLKERESMTRFLDYSYHQDESRRHLDYQNSEIELEQEREDVTKMIERNDGEGCSTGIKLNRSKLVRKDFSKY